jgi:NIMA (never in mitosis gene a)-related kinase
LTDSGDIKIGDFGISRRVLGEGFIHLSKIGTPLFLAPEIVKKQPFDFKVDVWGLGCVLYYLAALEPPFQVQKQELPRNLRSE